MSSIQSQVVSQLDGGTLYLDLIVEAPLGIFINQQHFATVMRTPGETPSDDLLLAQGLLFTKGIISCIENIERLAFSTSTHDPGEEPLAFINATLQASEREAAAPLEKVEPNLELIRTLPNLYHRPLHEKTGNCAAATIFNSDGERLCSFEDVHSNNAIDKAFGFGLENYFLPATEPLTLLVSSAVDVEIVRKALAAQIQTVVSLAPVSSAAVDLATRHNINLIGFQGIQGLTVYTSRG